MSPKFILVAEDGGYGYVNLLDKCTTTINAFDFGKGSWIEIDRETMESLS